MAAKDWQLLSEDEVFKTPYGRTIIKRVYKLPDGKVADFYIKKETDACGIVALTKDKKVILTKQFRPGPNKYMYDLPGGVIDVEDVSPAVAAGRELREETGYEGEIKYAGPCIDDAYSTMTRHCFVAVNCYKVADQELSEHEFVDVEIVTLEKFRELLKGGLLTDVELGYIGLDNLGLL